MLIEHIIKNTNVGWMMTVMASTVSVIFLAMITATTVMLQILHPLEAVFQVTYYILSFFMWFKGTVYYFVYC